MDCPSSSDPQTFRELFAGQPHMLRVLLAIGFSEADLDDPEEYQRSIKLARALVPDAFRDG